MKDNFEETIQYVVSVLKDSGYNPYEQLYAYASTGNEAYITRNGDARSMITQLDKKQLLQYVSKFYNK